MKWTGITIFTLLGLYSAALLLVDVQLGQDVARGYFSDIVTGTDYSLPCRAFFGINTTLSVVLLSGIALLFLSCIGLGQHTENQGGQVYFEWSQVFFFLFLACDERLLIHERMGSLLKCDDSLLIAGLGLVELFLLFLVGGVLRKPWRVKGWLIPAAACFAVMVCIDGLFPPCMRGRLALEDLSKTWASLFLLIYAWQYCLDSVTCSLYEVSDGS
jgi:hypothetical protein